MVYLSCLGKCFVRSSLNLLGYFSCVIGSIFSFRLRGATTISCGLSLIFAPKIDFFAALLFLVGLFEYMHVVLLVSKEMLLWYFTFFVGFWICVVGVFSCSGSRDVANGTPHSCLFLFSLIDWSEFTKQFVSHGNPRFWRVRFSFNGIYLSLQFLCVWLHSLRVQNSWLTRTLSRRASEDHSCLLILTDSLYTIWHGLQTFNCW